MLDAVSYLASGKKHEGVGFKAGESLRKFGERQQRGLLDFIGNPQNTVDFDTQRNRACSQLLIACE